MSTYLSERAQILVDRRPLFTESEVREFLREDPELAVFLNLELSKRNHELEEQGNPLLFLRRRRG